MVIFVCDSFLAKRGVKEDIQTFDARKINPDIRKSVEELIRKSGDSFEAKVCMRLLLFSTVCHSIVGSVYHR